MTPATGETRTYTNRQGSRAYVVLGTDTVFSKRRGREVPHRNRDQPAGDRARAQNRPLPGPSMDCVNELIDTAHRRKPGMCVDEMA